VIVLVDDRRDAILLAVHREQFAMIVLNRVDLVVSPGGRLQCALRGSITSEMKVEDRILT
jgi:hypothetical protein